VEVYIIDLVRIAFMFLIALGLAGPLTWAERRQAAAIQDRVGPNRAPLRIFGGEYRAFGLLHPIADVIKLITKEDTINHEVDRWLYNIAPFIALFPALVTFAVVPFGPDIIVDGVAYPLQVARVEAGVLYIFAMSSLAVFGVTLAGYASRNKFALLGGLRASAQMISYEVTMGLSVIGLVMAFGTLEPHEMVQQQGELLWGWLPNWGVFIQPVALIIFLVAAIAENKRTPFDLAEGESEIIGYFVEYSGMKFGMFFMAEYVEIVLIAGVLTTLFFGGYQVPWMAATTSGEYYFHFLSYQSGTFSQPVGVILQIGAFMTKLLTFIWFQLMVRWSLPRFRYDQVMNLGWKVLLPISLLNVFVTALVILW